MAMDKNCRIMWHAIRTKATGYGTAWFTRDECRRHINGMEDAQTYRVAQGDDALLWWSIEQRR